MIRLNQTTLHKMSMNDLHQLAVCREREVHEVNGRAWVAVLPAYVSAIPLAFLLPALLAPQTYNPFPLWFLIGCNLIFWFVASMFWWDWVVAIRDCKKHTNDSQLLKRVIMEKQPA